MAGINERKKELSSDLNNTQTKSMNRSKPQQQLYRPGNGPLRKSNNSGLGAAESDTNLIINARQNTPKEHMSLDDTRYRSEGSSPRDKVSEIDSCTSRLGDTSLNKDTPRRQKKPEQLFYVPKQVAHARESVSQDYDRNMSQGTDQSYERDRFANRSKRYSNRRKENMDYQDEWRDKQGNNRHMRQGSEPRGVPNGTPWQRQRDTRSVDPTLPPNRNYNEKIQSKPPSGRRHSTIGLEEKRPKNNINLPPRLQKKLLEGKLNSQQPTVEETWDGSSITFQGTSNMANNYLKNPSYHPMNNYSSMHGNHLNNQNAGYHTLPNRPRGRGRLQQDYPTPGDGYRSMTPDLVRSPCNSRPPTPPRGRENPSAQTPASYKHDDHRGYNDHRNFDDRFGRSNKIYDTPKTERIQHRTSEDRDRWEYDGRRENVKRDQDRRAQDRRNQDNRRDRGDRREPGGRYDRNRRPEKKDYHRKDDCRGDYNRNQDYRRDNKEEFYKNNNRILEEPTTAHSTKFTDSLESQLSPVSPESPEEIKTYIPIVDTTLDWSEEVELNDRLEQEALSDALTRSSSMASLLETSTKSMPSNVSSTSSIRKSKRRNRRKSKQRNDSYSRDDDHDRENSRTRIFKRRDSCNSVDSTRENFKVPDSRPARRRRSSRDQRDSSYDRYHSRNTSRDTSFERSGTSDNWRAEMRPRHDSQTDSIVSERTRNNSDKEDVKLDMKKAGVLVLPPQEKETIQMPVHLAEQRFPDLRRNSPGKQKSLFDPSNPSKPIIIKSQSPRISVPGFSDNNESGPPQINTTDQFGNPRPNWYDENLEEYKSCHHPNIIQHIKSADTDLTYIITNGFLLLHWDRVEHLRNCLKEDLKYLLCKDLKFCETENVEQHLWRILYYNIIEVTRKAIISDPKNKEQYKGFILYLIDEGNKYFEGLLEILQDSHSFQLSSFLGNINSDSKKGLGYIGLALNSAQKILIFLGDLGRYREQVNESSNYGKCRQWYIKAHEINPKNGKPYNQLAILAVYSRRKLDAVYYYMRSLMSSNPVPSARESLLSLFNDIRKKYEQGEKKRREERQERARQQMKQKESEEVNTTPNSLRKETWIRLDGGRRVHRTTQALQDDKDSEEEDLASLSNVELNKRFVITYLHVLGKLFTKTGMETFQEAALQMLKELRALLQHTPVPLPCNRLLQLLALNMFAIESTQLKNPQLQNQSGYRSENQERALVISLQMFNLILERCITLLEEFVNTNQTQINLLSQDVNILLPAIKIWCDWMLCHSSVWNPPPSTQDFKVGTTGDCWTRLATLMNIFEQLKEHNSYSKLTTEQQEGYELVRLPEDSVLCGFTPITYKDSKSYYSSKDVDIEHAQFALRVEKLLFFGTEFVCGLEPLVLKLEIEDGFREYISVVCTSNSRDSPPSPPELDINNEVLLESFSGDEEDENTDSIHAETTPEIRDLLTRKVELEKKKRNQELHLQRVKKILSQSVVSVHLEVRPKYLVPDTNCFVDHLDKISIIASTHNYTLMVPIVVLSELEGLAKGGKSPMPDSRKIVDPQHILKVADSAKKALDFLKGRPQSVKCVTTKGAVLTSAAFTTEDDSLLDNNLKNDDKILATCLVLCKNYKDQTNAEGDAVTGDSTTPRQLVREVVLLTEDRNLRVKAHARDVPVRELPDFLRWAGLGG